MSTLIPNRVAAGRRTGGQFATKVNGEQDIELPDTEVDATQEWSAEIPAPRTSYLEKRRSTPEGRADLDNKIATLRQINIIKNAQSTVEMGAALQSVLGERGKVSGFDTPKIDLERTREVAVTAARLFAKYPKVNAGVSIEQIKDSKTTAMATAKRRRGQTKCFDLEIKISSGKLKANSKLNEKFEQAKAHGWHHVVNEDVTPMKYAVTHEFGHLLEYSAPLSLYRVQKEYAISKGFDNGVTMDAYRYLRENSTKYGHTSSSELMAEAFADTEVNGKDAFEYSQVVHREMVKELDNA